MNISYISVLAIATILSTISISSSPVNAETNSSSGTNLTQFRLKACAGKKPVAARNPEVFTASKGIALRGQDVVSYFTDSKVVPGSSKFTHKWNGSTWQFSSAKNRDLFAQNPGKYAPQYGGYCAQGASEGNLVTTKAEDWKIVNGKLYLNYDGDVQKEWIKDIPGHITKADKQWPKILNNKEVEGK